MKMDMSPNNLTNGNAQGIGVCAPPASLKLNRSKSTDDSPAKP